MKTASAIVIITSENTGWPSIGRTTNRSMPNPTRIAAAMTANMISGVLTSVCSATE